jgi:hypothetical protein
MNDIEFIKWLCDKAEVFMFETGSGLSRVVMNIEYKPCFTTYHIHSRDHLWVNVYYPLLLQRAIEGVNLNHVVGCKITQADHDIIVRDYITSEVFRIFRIAYSESDYRFDQAKESALKYIYEQETACKNVE